MSVDLLVHIGLDPGHLSAGLPPITVRSGERTWTVGTGEPGATGDADAIAAAATPPKLRRICCARRNRSSNIRVRR